MSYKQYASFESQIVCVDTTQGKLMISNIHFPGYSAKHRFTHAMSIEDFQDFTNEDLNLSGPCIVHGDFSIHMEDANRPKTNEMKAVLQLCDLICMSTSKTHTLGGQIDLILRSREAISLVSSIDVLYELQISDNYLYSLKVYLSLSVEDLQCICDIRNAHRSIFKFFELRFFSAQF